DIPERSALHPDVPSHAPWAVGLTPMGLVSKASHARISSKRPEDTQSPPMLERSPRDEVQIAAPPGTPAWRPLAHLAAGVATMAGMIALAVYALSPRGFGGIALVLVVLFAITLPWYVIGFLNAAIGFVIMRFARAPAAAVAPVAGRVRGDEPITTSTA